MIALFQIFKRRCDIYRSSVLENLYFTWSRWKPVGESLHELAKTCYKCFSN